MNIKAQPTKLNPQNSTFIYKAQILLRKENTYSTNKMHKPNSAQAHDESLLQRSKKKKN